MKTQWNLAIRDGYKHPHIDQCLKYNFKHTKIKNIQWLTLHTSTTFFSPHLKHTYTFYRPFTLSSYFSYHVFSLFLSYPWLASWMVSICENSVFFFTTNRFHFLHSTFSLHFLQSHNLSFNVFNFSRLSVYNIHPIRLATDLNHDNCLHFIRHYPIWPLLHQFHGLTINEKHTCSDT